VSQFREPVSQRAQQIVLDDASQKGSRAGAVKLNTSSGPS